MRFIQALIFVSLLVSNMSFAATNKSTLDLNYEARRVLVEKLLVVLPAYIQATSDVLKEIDSLPTGKVSETTRLDEIPVQDLFAKNASPLEGVLDEQAFAEGRTEEDVAWLRQSKGQLQELLSLVVQVKVGEPLDPEIDKYLFVERNFAKSVDEFEVNVLLNPVSRFYCNLSVRIERTPLASRPVVTAEETCD